jgi:hypothetical protein
MSTGAWTTTLVAVLLGATLAPLRASAQLMATIAMARGQNARDGIEISLNRALDSQDGELVLVVDGVDVTALSSRTASSISYRPPDGLPDLSGDVVVFARHGNRWTEIKRFVGSAVKAAGAPAFSATRSASVGNKGQLAEGRSGGIPSPDRRRFQDFIFNAGVHTSKETPIWSLSTQSNYMGVSRRQDALRFGVRGTRAPMLDLSDYLVALRMSNAALSLGHVSFGTSRHLASNVAARGAMLSWTDGPTTFAIGALSGSPQVGWSDPVGLERPTNRMFGATIGREVVRSRPGVLRVDATVLDGSKLPIAGFTQGAIVDAEKSAGGTLQISAASPSQRFRVASGYTRSRFENPRRDTQLLDGIAAPRPTPTTRGAIFAEGTAAVLQNAGPFGAHAPTSLTVGIRHERIDPLFRSIAAQTAADRQESVADATMSVGAVILQASQNWNHDNVGRIASVLTTNGRTTTTSLAVPIGSIGDARHHAAFFPTLTLALNRVHQFADELPTNGSFRDQDLPDQVSLITDAAAMWQAGRVRLTVHANRSNQDNRQPLREQADFAAGVAALSIGTALGSRGDVTVDLGKEFQSSKERNETTRVRRYTLNGTLRPLANTGLLGAVSLVHSRPPVGSVTVDTDARMELSQNLLAGPSGPRGQLFLRYGRTASFLPDLTLLAIERERLRREQWTVSSGFNWRLF